MLDLSLSTKYKVNSAETDMFGRLRLGAFVNLLIQSAIKSADKLGFGWNEMSKQNLFWVLNRLTLQIEQIPSWYDRITIETWPKDIHKILYLRDYIIRDGDENIIARATTAWLALDSVSRRPKHVSTDSIGHFTLLKGKHSIKELPEKLLPVTPNDIRQIQSTYFDIDLNKHVTSTRYIDWMMDSFPQDFHENAYPRLLSVNYMKETRLTDTISLRKEQTAGNEFRFEGNNDSLNTIAFRGKIVF